MKDKSLKILCCLVIAFFILSGCASIVSKSNWPINIRSSPEQANVTITDMKEGKEIFQGQTPATVTLSSKGGYFKSKTYMVKVSKEGFETQNIEIVSNINGWYFGNILLGGLLGMLIVDPLTGAMWTLDPKEINLTLLSKASEVPSGQGVLSIVLLGDVPDELRNKLIKIKE